MSDNMIPKVEREGSVVLTPRRRAAFSERVVVLPLFHHDPYITS
jgi:hypothetical protein